MKPVIHFSLLLIVLQLHSGHGDKDPIASSTADFAFNFFREVASPQDGKNILFSPLSISMAFSMVGMGARGNTQNQIYQGLGLTSIDTTKIHKGFKQIIRKLNRTGSQIDIGNAMWIKNTFKILSKFSKDVKSLYKAEGFNFEQITDAEANINKYVAEKTQGKIKEAVKNLDPLTCMVLVNYIYFKDGWKYPFNPQKTHKENFFIEEGMTVKVDMMKNFEKYRYFHDEALSCSVVELPYKGGATAWFILPDQGQLKKVEDALREETLSNWRTSFTNGTQVILSLPKFSMSASYDLENVLPGLGITDVFSENADLSGISKMSGLELTKAPHEAVLDVCEEGSEAAAVSSVVFGYRSPGSYYPPQFIFNRAFLHIIFAPNDEAILFMGKVVNPVQK